MYLLSQSFYPQHDGCAHLESYALYYLNPLYSVGFKRIYYGFYFMSYAYVTVMDT